MNTGEIESNENSYREYIFRQSLKMTPADFVNRWLVGNWLYNQKKRDYRHFVRNGDGTATCEASADIWQQKGADVPKQCVSCQIRLMDITRAGRELGLGNQGFRPPPANRAAKNIISWSQNYISGENENNKPALIKKIYVECRLFGQN